MGLPMPLPRFFVWFSFGCLRKVGWSVGWSWLVGVGWWVGLVGSG